jgi:anti-anti-sigma regulatory factor
MLRITSISSEDAACLVLEGKLAGQWVEELARAVAVARSAESGRVRLDLTGVTFVDSEGRKLLERAAAEGVEFRTEGVMNCFLVEDIKRRTSRQERKNVNV